jgi:hypothetical protein
MFKVTVCTCRERGIGSCGDDVRNRYDTRERGRGEERRLVEGRRGWASRKEKNHGRAALPITSSVPDLPHLSIPHNQSLGISRVPPTTRRQRSETTDHAPTSLLFLAPSPPTTPASLMHLQQTHAVREGSPSSHLPTLPAHLCGREALQGTMAPKIIHLQPPGPTDQKQMSPHCMNSAQPPLPVGRLQACIRGRSSGHSLGES